ncbi:alpha-carbonic anhydrase [Daphnia pulex]|uniref:Carbonic anhydrase n=1 Tax=Daphnia pulex TaxID=6669 RepID=E9FX50_DAPPU|nr:alpha-carbonic anhydrase [Daphnia pulex]|eukprot:EFX88011.1 alpha-carbonic anhydrase [Daphnia pulex]
MIVKNKTQKKKLFALTFLRVLETGLSRRNHGQLSFQICVRGRYVKKQIPITNKPKWTYKDQMNWPRLFPTCGTRRQSPIDIQPKETVLASFPNFVFHNYGHINNMTMVNNGHTVTINLPEDYPKHKMPHITGGGLNGTYNFAQMHMHWGVDSTLGSEHRIKSRSHPLELHVIHWNSKYGSFAQASMHAEDGLAVFSVLAEVGLGDNKSLMPITDQVGEVTKNGDETVLRKPVALNDILPKQKSSYFRYFGSVTTPLCHEIVTWTVFDNFIDISEKQLAKLRNLKDERGERLVNNFRTPQPLHDRTVFYRSFTGCEISRSLSDATSMADVFKWTKCLMSYAFNSIFSSS